MSTTKKRKLRAIFFADIVGYTSLMQKDEAQASAFLQKFRNTLDKKVIDYEGDIIQYYGDGCLCTFESSVNAMNCAREVQTIFKTKPSLPVRIGMDSGDVVFEAGNVYGDTVNLASRIESLGIAGSILFSSRINRQIANQKSFKVTSLGSFDFKNVNQPMEVFALANEGFVIPRPAEMKGKLKNKAHQKNKWLIPALLTTVLLALFGFWYAQTQNTPPLIPQVADNIFKPEAIKNKKLAVLVFENQTNNEQLDVFGKMISDWISGALIENGVNNLISAKAVQKNMEVAEQSGIRFNKVTGAEVFIDGRYYIQNKELLLRAQMVEAKTGNIIHAFPLMKTAEQNYMDLLSDLNQQVMSYCLVGQDEKYVRRLPKYNAYQSYLKGKFLFGTKNRQAAAAFMKAFHLDNTYIEPLIKLIPLYTNLRQYPKADSLIQLIHSLPVELTEYEKLRTKIYECKLNGDLKKELAVNETLTKEFPKGDSQLDIIYMHNNMPSKVLELKKQNWRGYEDKNCYTCQWSDKYVMLAYFKTKQYQAVKTFFENITYDIIDVEIIVNYLRALVRLRELDLVDVTINRYSKAPLSLYGASNINSILPSVVAYELFLMDKEEAAGKYTNMGLEWVQKARFPWNHHIPFKQSLYFVKKDYQKVIDNVLKLPYHPNSIGNVGACYAYLGKKEEAIKIIQQIEKTTPRYDLDGKGLCSFRRKRKSSNLT